MNNASGRFYWLKLKRDFFKRHDIRIVEAMTNGKEYILFYLKLLCEALDHEGNLRFSDLIPYNEEMLATITNTNVDVVRQAVQIFKELNMLEIMDDGTIYMCEVEAMTGSAIDNDNANRQRRFRERKKQQALLLRYSSVTKNNENKNKSKNKSKNKNIYDIEFPSFEDVESYIKEKNLNVSAEEFHDYYFENYWSNGIELSKDWRKVAKEWHARRKNKTKKIELPAYIQKQKDGIIEEGRKITKAEAEEIKAKVTERKSK